jgi:hypothetical protein
MRPAPQGGLDVVAGRRRWATAPRVLGVAPERAAVLGSRTLAGEAPVDVHVRQVQVDGRLESERRLAAEVCLRVPDVE